MTYFMSLTDSRTEFKYSRKDYGKDKFTMCWTTIGLAFTNVATRLSELHHITLQPQWMTDLTNEDIVGIYTRFHTICFPHETYHMRLPSNHQSHPSLGYVLARSMMQVICDEASPSFYVCALAVAASDFCKPFRDSLDAWVFDASFM